GSMLRPDTSGGSSRIACGYRSSGPCSWVFDFMAKRRPGRPPGQSRKSSAKKREPDLRGIQAYHRLASGGATALGCDPRLVSPASLLEMRGKLSARQREACFKVGDIVRQFHRWHGGQLSPPSIKFEGGTRAHDSIGELFDPDADLDTGREDKRSNLTGIM